MYLASYFSSRHYFLFLSFIGKYILHVFIYHTYHSPHQQNKPPNDTYVSHLKHAMIHIVISLL